MAVLSWLISLPVTVWELVGGKEKQKQTKNSLGHKCAFHDIYVEVRGQLTHVSLFFHFVSSIVQTKIMSVGGRCHFLLSLPPDLVVHFNIMIISVFLTK